MAALLTGTVLAQAPATHGGKEPKAGERMVLKNNGIEYPFRWCPAGTFMMGYEDMTPHRVTLTQGFWMLETPVTQEMWDNIMSGYFNPSYFKGDKKLPVDNVSWNNCQEYIRALNKLSKAPKGYKFSLPTEAQWEYACRAGTTTAYCFGEYSKIKVEQYAWYSGAKDDDELTAIRGEVRKNGQTHPVGEKKPNAWSLYDMHGNVWEWCNDWYGSYPSGDVTDPTGPETGSSRVCRGGSWDSSALDCRSASRQSSGPATRYYYHGLRLALVSESEKASQPKQPVVQDNKKAGERVNATEGGNERKVKDIKTKIDRDTPLKVLQAEAEKGNPDAQCWLAICYEIGLQDCNIDKPQAEEWFSKAAKHTDEKSAAVQHSKAVCYGNGYGIAKTKDLEKAAEWHRKAAEQGFAPAQCSLGLCYLKGEGISKDHSEAFQLFEKAAKQKHPLAYVYIYSCYANGQGTKVNRDQADSYLEMALDCKLPEAQYAQGMNFLVAEANGATIVKWFRLAAERGHDGGQCQLGNCYYFGIGGLGRNIPEAVKWYRKSAEQGNSAAKKRLAQLGY